MKKRKLWRALSALVLCIALLCGMFVSAEELIPGDDAAANVAPASEAVTGLDDLGDIDDLGVLDDIPTLDLDASLALDDELIFVDPQSPAIDPQPEAVEPVTDIIDPVTGIIEPESEVTEAEAGPAEPEPEAAEPETESATGALPAETEEAQMAGDTTQYTVIFLGDDGEALQTKTNYTYNEALVYICQPPTKAADETYKSYAFDGWVDSTDTGSTPTVYTNDNLPNVTADKTYRAHFTPGDFVEYTVTFVNDDGKNTELWRKKDFHYNDTLKYGSNTPTKTDDKNTYAFAGWVRKSDGKAFSTTDTLPNVTANETYTAKYTSTPKEPVQLEVRYEGQSPLTKVYDCNKYGIYTKNEEMHVLIDQWKDVGLEKSSDIKKKLFALYLSAGSSMVEGHKSIGYSLTGLEQFPSADAGSYEFKFTFKLTGDDAAYYTLKETTVTVPAIITQREVVLTPRAGLSKVYGAKDPVYRTDKAQWLDSDESSPLHQDISGLPTYAVPVNTVDGSTKLTVTNAAYIKQYAKEKGIKFFNAWLTRASGEEPGKYRINLGDMSFGPNFKVTLAEEYFTITKKSIADENVTATVSNQKYTGKAIEVSKAAMVVKYNGKRLLRDVDYKVVSYSNNKSVSTASKMASVKIQGIGKRYTGTRTIKFSIVDSRIAIASATASAIADKTYTGKAIKPAPVLKYKGKTLKKGTDYTLAYASNKAVGKATITVTGRGKYKGSRKLYFNIVPKGVAISKLTSGKKKATLTWGKGSGITGYQIEYHIYNNSKSGKKLSIKGLKTTSRTVSGLTSKKTYVFRIRTYKTVNGKNYYSAWSKPKNIKVK